MSIAWLFKESKNYTYRRLDLLTGLIASISLICLMAVSYVVTLPSRATHSFRRLPRPTLTQSSSSAVLAATPTPTHTPTETPTPTPTPSVTPTPTPKPAARSTKKPTSTAKPAVTNPVVTSTYPVHTNILTTMFWAGESATEDNSFISNAPSAWMDDWTSQFGGVDAPSPRNGYLPTGFTPKENAFYFALPYSDYGDNGPKANVTRVYWYKPFADGQSILKNRWLAVTFNGKTAYAQWEDVGPYQEDDVDYVFGSAKPKDKVGLDVSPAVSSYLGLGDQGTTSWRFVNDNEVPDGPWKQKITTSGPAW